MSSNYPAGAERALEIRDQNEEAFDRWIEDTDYPLEKRRLAAEWAAQICSEVDNGLEADDRVGAKAHRRLSSAIFNWLDGLPLQNLYLANVGAVPPYDIEREREEALMEQADRIIQERKEEPRP